MVILVISVILGIQCIPDPEISIPISTPTGTPAGTPTKLPSRTVEPLSIPTPEKVPVVPSKTSTPRPTGVEVTAEIVRKRCEYYRPIVEEMYEYFPVDPDLVLAIMAQESACDPNATDGVSIGLMQVTPKSWTLTEEWLWQPKWNIWQGMWMLHGAIYNERENPEHDVWRAVAAYNCGWVSLNADKCLYFGGPVYADRVFDFWLPYFK